MSAVAAAVLAAALTACQPSPPAGPPAADSHAKTTPDSHAKTTPADHTRPPLIIVMLENESYSDAVGNASMPFFNKLWREGKNGTGPVTIYTRMHAITHPSLPNYVAITSGGIHGQDTDTVEAGQIHATSLWDQLTAAGISWDVFQDAMPIACDIQHRYEDPERTNGLYVIHHNPGIIYARVFASVKKCLRVVPLSALRTSALPAVSFVTPNECDNFHGVFPQTAARFGYKHCIIGSAALRRRSDSWLAAHVTAWTAAGADVLITWDEGTEANANSTTGGQRIASLLTGPFVPPGHVGKRYSHYSVLAGIEDRYRLRLLGQAATANPIALPLCTCAPVRPVVGLPS
jgi:phosphatidylinositol-3-phosphatase